MMFKKLLLQCKFVIVQFLNTSINFVPVFLRRYYLLLFNIKLGNNSTIHRGVKFFHIGQVTIGTNSTVNFNCYLDNRRGIFIGNNVGIAHDSKIYTLGHDLNNPKFSTIGSPVRILDNVFIFSNSIIMPGVTIFEGAVVLSGSVVTKDVAAYTIVGGNPAKKIKDRLKEIDYSQKYQYLFAL
jgi:acetyltransferase-like isoleucine patch superfamily enzyme